MLSPKYSSICLLKEILSASLAIRFDNSTISSSVIFTSPDRAYTFLLLFGLSVSSGDMPYPFKTPSNS